MVFFIIFLIATRNSLSKTWNDFVYSKNINKIYFIYYVIVIYLKCKVIENDNF